MNKQQITLMAAAAAVFSGLTITTVSAAPGPNSDQGPTQGVPGLPTSTPSSTGGGGPTTTAPPTTGPPPRSGQALVPPAGITTPPTSTKRRPGGANGVLPSLAQEPGGTDVPEAPWAP
ncbi:hypothetical protein [Nocardia sp. NPDC050710]|uniref:hypothetical protein n=1 Tax=Nocardia sp. NPDC050710 TaxID=3157220 RepID=UPI0033F3C4A2